MIKLTKKDMIRRNLNLELGLDGNYNTMGECIVKIIASEPAFKEIDLKTAVELCMLDLEVENASFHDVLKPYYNENYDLIPVVGIDGVMNLAVVEYLTVRMTSEDSLNAIGRVLAFDHALSLMKDDDSYSPELMDFINDMIPTAYYDIKEMLDDIATGVEMTVLSKPKKKEVKKPDFGVKVIVLDNTDIADDILTLLKLINEGK